MRKITIIVSVIATLLISPTKTISQSWTQKQDIPNTPTSGRWGAYCFTIGNKIYAGGGYIGNFSNLNDLWEYDPSTGNWTAKADLPVANGRTNAVAFSINGKGYVGLGVVDYFGLSTKKKDLWEYDPSGNSWTQKAQLPGLPRESATCFVLNNKAYVVGGAINYTYTYSAEVWEYDPAINQWTARQNFPTDITSSQGFAIGNYGYVVGGTSDSLPSKKTYQFDPIDNSWNPKQDYCDALGRTCKVAFVLNNQAYVGLGYSRDATYNYTFSDFCIYDTTTGWSTGPALPSSPRGRSIAAVANNKAYVGAGFLYNAGEIYFKDWWEFSTTTNINDLNENKNLISIFPNPASQTISVNFANSQKSSFKIINALGEAIKSGVLSNNSNNVIDVSDFSNGIYSIVIFNNATTQSKSFIKN
jgi:N-acetylneuraminic acid mutarotase